VEAGSISSALTDWASGLTRQASKTADENAATATLTHTPRSHARLQFGDGRAGARIATAVHRLLQLARTPATFAAYQACRADLSADTRALAHPANADHTSHSFHWHSGEEALLPSHARHHRRVECSAQPPVPTIPPMGLYELLAQPSTYDL
jgi:hypothetical protein